MSGGYEEDADVGLSFTYTGCGGRELSGDGKNLRTAPQSMDQTFDNPLNAALQKSVETGKPIRVLRGFKCPSPFAPAAGYRYDGLYTCVKAWLATSPSSGFLVCRYALVRLPGQPAIPVQAGREEEARKLLDDAGVEMPDAPSTPGLASDDEDAEDVSEVESPADVTPMAPTFKDEVESPTRRLRSAVRA